MAKPKKTVLIITIITLISTLILATIGIIMFRSMKTDNFAKDVEAFEDRSSKYIIEDYREYTNIVVECNMIINNKKTGEIDKMLDTLNTYEEKITTENETSLNKSIDEFNKIDKSTLSTEKQNKIKIALTEIKSYIEEKDYKTADSKLKDLNESLEKDLLITKVENINKELKEVKGYIDNNNLSKALEILNSIKYTELNTEQKSLYDSYKKEIAKLQESNESANTNKDLTKEELWALIESADSIKLKESYGDEYSWTYLDYEDTQRLMDTWGLPNEPYYHFMVQESQGNMWNPYVIGKNSKKIYRCPTQGGVSIYEVQNNKVVKEYKYLMN